MVLTNAQTKESLPRPSPPTTGPSRQATDLSLLQALMKQPFEHHPDAAIPGGIKAADVHAVLASLKKVSKYERHDGMTGGEGPAFHNIVYHLAGGADAELRPPPRKGDDHVFSANLKRDANKMYGDSWVSKRAALKNDPCRWWLVRSRLDPPIGQAGARRRREHVRCRIAIGRAGGREGAWRRGEHATRQRRASGRVVGVSNSL